MCGLHKKIMIFLGALQYLNGNCWAFWNFVQIDSQFLGIMGGLIKHETFFEKEFGIY